MTPALSPRQVEVLRLRALGLTNAAIAARLGISSRAVKSDLNGAYGRLDAACLPDALRAVGWLQVPGGSAW